MEYSKQDFLETADPQTLRQYERLGLVVPCRVDGKNRLYSENDIEKLQFICYNIIDFEI